MDRPVDKAQQALEHPLEQSAPTSAPPPPTPAPGPVPIEAPVAADPEDPSHALLHMPMRLRSASLSLLAALLAIATLKWAAPFFIPVMIGLLLSYALSPIVDRLQRWHVPRALSAGVLIVGLLGGAGAGAWSFCHADVL